MAILDFMISEDRAIIGSKTKLLENRMRKENLENLVHIRHTEGKESDGKVWVAYILGMSECLLVKEQNVLILSSKIKKIRCAMIAHVLNLYGIEKIRNAL